MQRSGYGGPAPRLFFSLFLGFVLISPARAFVGQRDCSTIASEFSRAASRAGRRHIAIVPFRDAEGRESRSGSVIAERLVASLLDRGGVEVLERSQLEDVLRELRFASAGAVDPGMVKRLGHFLGVDAVVVGTTVELLASQVEIHARLIDVETARVLAASIAKVEKDWSDFDGASVWSVSAPPVPLFPGDQDPPDWRDGPNAFSASEQVPCDAAAALEARARYWAMHLREPGFSPAALRGNPGSEIADPRMRERFYSRLRMWYGEDRIPSLSAAERATLASCR